MAISYTLTDKNNDNIDDDFESLIKNLMTEFNDIPISNNDVFCQDDNLIAEIIHYDTNYNVKQLLTICEYYGLLKEVRGFKKEDIITHVLLFENSHDNNSIVLKRKEMWYYMDQLKDDDKMKKYIMWK